MKRKKRRKKRICVKLALAVGFWFIVFKEEEENLVAATYIKSDPYKTELQCSTVNCYLRLFIYFLWITW